MNVPFLDLKAQYASIRDDINTAIREVLECCAFSGGPFVETFEKEWAAYCGVPYAVGVGSGTEAIRLALVALEIGPGDEVITVSNSFLATAEAISLVGATPIFVDIHPQTYTMNPSLVEGAITERTRAVIPVHIFGQCADMDPLMEIARDRSLLVIEDACQAHGAEYKGRKAGTIGDVGCFSFYPGKNLGAYGEAGAVVTSDQGISERIHMLRDHGQRRKYNHQMVGCNGRMDGLQGAVLSVKLKYLDDWIQARRHAARQYDELLSDMNGLVLPEQAQYGSHVFHIYAVRTRDRDSLIESLRAKGIQCGIHYPIPIHLQQAYRFLGLEKGSFPITEDCASELISLPMFAELSVEQIRFVASNLRVTLERLPVVKSM